MAEAYYALPLVEAVGDESGLTLPRMQALHAACLRHRDFEVVELYRQVY